MSNKDTLIIWVCLVGLAIGLPLRRSGQKALSTLVAIAALIVMFVVASGARVVVTR